MIELYPIEINSVEDAESILLNRQSSCIDRSSAMVYLKEKRGEQYIIDNLGYSASTVRHHQRVHKGLSSHVQQLFRRNPSRLTFSHAKAICGLSEIEQKNTAEDVLARKIRSRALEKREIEGERSNDKYYADLSETLSTNIGHPVEIIQDKTKQNKGKICIQYFDLNDFEAVITDTMNQNIFEDY